MSAVRRSTTRIDLPGKDAAPITLKSITGVARVAMLQARKIREPDLVAIVVEGRDFKQSQRPLIATSAVARPTGLLMAVVALLDDSGIEGPRVALAVASLRTEIADRMEGS